jgi:hypothetical protein
MTKTTASSTTLSNGIDWITSHYVDATTRRLTNSRKDDFCVSLEDWESRERYMLEHGWTTDPTCTAGKSEESC